MFYVKNNAMIKNHEFRIKIVMLQRMSIANTTG